MRDPLAGSPWSTAQTVAGFVRSPPNLTLVDFAAREQARGGRVALDIGCGAGRNLVPLAGQGWALVGTDLSWPMLVAARDRERDADAGPVALTLAAMDSLPVRTASIDLVIAHGIWNLATTTAQFRAAVREAARVARPGAALFVFTFSRHTLPAGARPIAGETFVFTEFSGAPQIFLTSAELLDELRHAGFTPDDAVPLTEHNRPPAGQPRLGGPPVIYEAAFRRVA